MKRNDEILKLAEEIMLDITNDRTPLHNILLKASRLSLLVNIPENVKIFKDWAKLAEQYTFDAGSFNVNMEAAKDRNVSVASANPNQTVFNPMGNIFERNRIRQDTQEKIKSLAKFRTETYSFASNTFSTWQFGNLAEKIFDKKRVRTEPILRKIFPDINERLNSIEQNIQSDNSEDWKNAVASCRTLFMDLADILSPPKNAADKNSYMDRLKTFISPKISSKTKKKLTKGYLEEVKKRIEYTLGLTQGGAHKDRPAKEDAEDIVLYTYLIVSDLMSIYGKKEVKKSGDTPTNTA